MSHWDSPNASCWASHEYRFLKQELLVDWETDNELLKRLIKVPDSKSIISPNLPGWASPISGSSLRWEMMLCEYEGDSGGGLEAEETEIG